MIFLIGYSQKLQKPLSSRKIAILCLAAALACGSDEVEDSLRDSME
jgi:hypothetical protein